MALLAIVITCALWWCGIVIFMQYRATFKLKFWNTLMEFADWLYGYAERRRDKCEEEL